MKILSNINFINQIKAKPKQITRPVFETASTDGCVVHSEMPVLYKDGLAKLSTKCYPSYSAYESHAITTQITDESGRLMGDYSYSLDPVDRTIDYGYIKTKKDFRHKGVAEIMRLSSLMELKENSLSSIKIDALSDAVPFHSKYKFQPDIKGKNTALTILGSIVDKTKAGKKDKKNAEKLIENIVNDGSEDTLNLSPKQAKDVNSYITKYIKRNKDNWDDANFHHCLPMVLTKKQVNKFAAFYNKLFKKHGIDYTI